MKMDPLDLDIKPDPDTVDPDEPIEVVTDEVQIEVEDDTPEADRGRKPSDPPEEVTEEELANYGKKAKARLQHFTKSYHDERRAKEQALRERQAAEDLAKATRAELEKMRQQLNSTHKVAVTASTTQAEQEYAAATRAYKEAYEAGDADALVTANERMFNAKITLDRVKSIPQDLPVQETPLQQAPAQVYNEQNTQPATQVDPKAVAWHSQNPWFGAQKRMTAFAEGLHEDMIDSGVDPSSDEYYEKLNSRMRKAFPDYDWGDDDDTQASPDVEVVREPAPSRASKPASVVASAVRTTAPRKVKLTESEVRVAQKLGVPLEEYARQKVAMNNGGR